MPIPSRAIRTLLLAALLMSSPLWSTPAGAQEEELDTDLLFRVTLDPGILPPAPAFVRLVRISLEPGASSPAHTHSGPEFGRVEGGTLTVQVDGPALVKRRGSGDALEEAAQGEPFALERGEQITYLPGTAMTLRNEGDDPVRILAAVVLPAAEAAGPRITYVDGEPDEAALEGLSSQILGDGVARALPESGSTIVIERVRLLAEQGLPGEPNPTLLSVEDGDFAFDLEEGAAQVSRTGRPGPRADLEPGDDTSLAERDAIFFPNGFEPVSREGQGGPLTYLRMTVAPTSEEERLPEEGRGTISFNQVERSEDDGETDGETVYVNSNDVNLRAEPSTGAAVVATYQSGQVLTLTGDAVEAEGIRWIPVTNPDDGASGFISAALLSRQQDLSDTL